MVVIMYSYDWFCNFSVIYPLLKARISLFSFSRTD